jgi:hypothetical protein
MATRTIARLYDSYADASAAVRDLQEAGFPHDDISLIARGGGQDRPAEVAPERDGGQAGAAEGAGTGAAIGTLVGGGAGLLAGIGALAIPGLGPVVAAGWLVAAITGAGIGAATGGVIGALVQAGIGEEHAHVYAEGLRRGGNLVTVRTDHVRMAEAERILDRHTPVDIEARGREYRAGGWTRYDEAAAPVPGVEGPADAKPPRPAEDATDVAGLPHGTGIGRDRADDLAPPSLSDRPDAQPDHPPRI